MPLSAELIAGTVLTFAGWIGLLVAVVHSQRVIGRLNAPPVLSESESRDDSEPRDDE
jgi:hypothetical protein